MPDFVPIGYSMEARLTGLHSSGKKMYNILHFRDTVPLPSYEDCEEIGLTLAGWVQDTYNVMYHASIRIVEIRVRSNAAEPGPVYLNTSIDEVGLLVGDQLPMAQSICVNLTTNNTGPSQRGRFYAFTADEAQQTNGVYTVTYRNVAEACMADLKALTTALGFPWAIESRRRLALYDIQGFSAQVIPSTLRSRKPNHGI